MFQPCAAWAEKLAVTHPDDLSPIQWAELEAHVAHCSVCTAILAEYRSMDDYIRNYTAGQTVPQPSFPPLESRQHADNGDGLSLPVLDRAYRRSLQRRLSWYVVPLPTALRKWRVSLVILIVIICLIAGVLTGIYLLKIYGVVLR
jgi:hypothetical protein